MRYFQSGCLFCRNAHIFCTNGMMQACFYSVVLCELWHEQMIHLSFNLSVQQILLRRGGQYFTFPYINGTLWNHLSEFRLLAKPPNLVRYDCRHSHLCHHPHRRLRHLCCCYCCASIALPSPPLLLTPSSIIGASSALSVTWVGAHWLQVDCLKQNYLATFIVVAVTWLQHFRYAVVAAIGVITSIVRS